jgi:hypothetical protein
MRRFFAAILLTVPALAQENPAPKIEPTPRWDADVVRAMLQKEESVAAPVAAPDPPAPTAPQLIPLPQEAPTYLTGMEPNQVLAKLGKPSLDRRDGRLRMLQFTGRTCILDVVFWRAPVNPAPGALHVEARSLKGDRTETNACLQKQLAARGISVPKPAPVEAASVTEQAAAPIPPAQAAIHHEIHAEPLAPANPPAAATDPAPRRPLPAPGLSYPLGGPPPPQ